MRVDATREYAEFCRIRTRSILPRRARGPTVPIVIPFNGTAISAAWTAPFLMAPINTRVVRRTNALLNYQYGRDFRYDEAVLTSRGLMGWALAQSVSKGLKLFFSAAAIQPTRAVLERCVLPSPGQGPTAVQRERGAFEIQLVGKSEYGSVRLLVSSRYRGAQSGIRNHSKNAGGERCLLAQIAHCWGWFLDARRLFLARRFVRVSR